MADAKPPKFPANASHRRDDEVGQPGSPPAGGGRQTEEQAAITQLGGEGRSDADRRGSWNEAGGERPGQPTPVGGASGGHAEQTSADGTHGKVAAGHYGVEKTDGSKRRR